MAKPFSLQPLLDIMQERSDEATRRLGQLIAAEQNQKSRLGMLEGYRAEYAKKLKIAIETGITPLVLQNYRDFLARIDEAIEQQVRMVNQSETDTRRGQDEWRQQNRQLKALDTLSQRHDQRELMRENKQDQKIQDEFSTRKYSRAPDEA